MTVAIAHRGNAKQAIENTLEAFAAAVAAGADWIELDVQATRDGRAIILHDETFERLWHWPYPVNAVTWQEVADHFHGQIPLFDTVLEHVSLPLMVDFKQEAAAPAIVAAIERAKAWDRCLIVTGNIAGLRRVQSLAPQSARGLTWTALDPPEMTLLRSLDLQYFNPYWALVTASLVEALHRHHYGVSTWTVDDPTAMATLAKLGVDAIVSNDITRLVSALHSSSDPLS
ncbi:MAG: glycerophosphodiester phosphodiesterase [Firmicutes bacterium]|nr:glycerophosphodiester phosphodiesterase [Bacillota bacterium]